MKKVFQLISKSAKPAVFADMQDRLGYSNGRMQDAIRALLDGGKIRMVNRCADAGFCGTRSFGYRQIEIGYVACRDALNANI